MIEYLQRIARVVQKLRWLLIPLLPLFTALVALSVVSNPWFADDRWLMPGVAGLCWTLVLLSGGVLFETVPPKPSPEMPWLRRMRMNLHRGLMWLLGAAMIGLTGAVLVLSWNLLRVWIWS